METQTKLSEQEMKTMMFFEVKYVSKERMSMIKSMRGWTKTSIIAKNRIDAIKIICEAIATYKQKNASLLIITHYPKILSYLKPKFVHIMTDGKIIKTGNLELVERLEEKGYSAFTKT